MGGLVKRMAKGSGEGQNDWYDGEQGTVSLFEDTRFSYLPTSSYACVM